MPRYNWLEGLRDRWHHSTKGEDIFAQGEELWSATGSLWGARLLTVQTRKPAVTEEGMLDLDTYEVGLQADILTNVPAIHALTAWRRYNAGAVIEHRIEELAQLSTGKTAVDHLGGNALLWGLSAVTYQILHTLRRHFLTGSWRTAQPKRIRLWMIRLPAKLTTHGRKTYLQLLRDEPLRPRTPRCPAGTQPTPSRPHCPPEPNAIRVVEHNPGRRVSSSFPARRSPASVRLGAAWPPPRWPTITSASTPPPPNRHRPPPRTAENTAHRRIRVELVWVLRRAYGISRDRIATVPDELTATEGLEVEATDDVARAARGIGEAVPGSRVVWS